MNPQQVPINEADTVSTIPTDELTRLRAGAADFHMAYRIKCDEETKAQAVEIERLRAENDSMREALHSLLMRDERNTCQHEETSRGGAIWEICDACGAQWADDRGGKPEWKDPPEWAAARAALKEAK